MKFSTNEKKSIGLLIKGEKLISGIAPKFDTSEEDCSLIIKENFNYSKLYNISEKYDPDKDVFVSYKCEHTDKLDMLWGAGFYLTAGFFPAKIEIQDTVSMSLNHKRISPKPYLHTFKKAYYISWFLIPVQLVQFIFRSNENEDMATFTKNVSDRIYYEMPQTEAEIAKMLEEEKEREKERVKREAEEESEREKKKKAAKEREKKAEAEIAEKKAKAKKITIPKGGLYCTHSGFAMGLAVDPSRENFRQLELIKGCFEADRPIKAKISDLGNNTNIVIVYIGNDEFFSTERLLGLKKRI